MIASVRGTVLSLSPDTAVVEVGGVGLLLHCTPAALGLMRVGEQAAVSTSLVVREESLTLYGFADADERAIFESVQTVSGIGPRIAQAMLAAMAPMEIRRAVAAGDVKALTAVPGIGQKGAQRLVLELRDRLAPPAADYVPATVPTGGWAEQVHAALVGLGWGSREADEAVERVRAEVDAGTLEPSAPLLLRAALRSLDRG